VYEFLVPDSQDYTSSPTNTSCPLSFQSLCLLQRVALCVAKSVKSELFVSVLCQQHGTERACAAGAYFQLQQTGSCCGIWGGGILQQDLHHRTHQHRSSVVLTAGRSRFLLVEKLDVCFLFFVCLRALQCSRARSGPLQTTPSFCSSRLKKISLYITHVPSKTKVYKLCQFFGFDSANPKTCKSLFFLHFCIMRKLVFDRWLLQVFGFMGSCHRMAGVGALARLARTSWSACPAMQGIWQVSADSRVVVSQQSHITCFVFEAGLFECI
jgi:hypothetical protein